eukprot:SAG31_NODE_435_length_15733_cov_6.508251_12_plen_171_part_00
MPSCFYLIYSRYLFRARVLNLIRACFFKKNAPGATAQLQAPGTRQLQFSGLLDRPVWRLHTVWTLQLQGYSCTYRYSRSPCELRSGFEGPAAAVALISPRLAASTVSTAPPPPPRTRPSYPAPPTRALAEVSNRIGGSVPAPQPCLPCCSPGPRASVSPRTAPLRSPAPG